MSNSEQIENQVEPRCESEVDEIDKAFEVAKTRLKRKLSTLETQQIKLANATSQLRVAFAMFQEDSKRAEAITLKLFEKQPPYSHEDQTEVAVQFAVAAASRARLERIIGAQFVGIEQSIFEPEINRHYSQDHGRTILAALGVQPREQEEPKHLELNKNFAVDYQRCLRAIVTCAISAARLKTPDDNGEIPFVVDFGYILPETQIVLGKLVKLEWYADYYECRGGKQFEDHCGGCRGCRGSEEARTREICARCTLVMNLAGKKLANSPEELARQLDIYYFW